MPLKPVEEEKKEAQVASSSASEISMSQNRTSRSRSVRISRRILDRSSSNRASLALGREIELSNEMVGQSDARIANHHNIDIIHQNHQQNSTSNGGHRSISNIIQEEFVDENGNVIQNIIMHDNEFGDASDEDDSRNSQGESNVEDVPKSHPGIVKEDEKLPSWSEILKNYRYYILCSIYCICFCIFVICVIVFGISLLFFYPHGSFIQFCGSEPNTCRTSCSYLIGTDSDIITSDTKLPYTYCIPKDYTPANGFCFNITRNPTHKNIDHNDIHGNDKFNRYQSLSGTDSNMLFASAQNNTNDHTHGTIYVEYPEFTPLGFSTGRSVVMEFHSDLFRSVPFLYDRTRQKYNYFRICPCSHVVRVHVSTTTIFTCPQYLRVNS